MRRYLKRVKGEEAKASNKTLTVPRPIEEWKKGIT